MRWVAGIGVAAQELGIPPGFILVALVMLVTFTISGLVAMKVFGSDDINPAFALYGAISFVSIFTLIPLAIGLYLHFSGAFNVAEWLSPEPEFRYP